MIRYTFMNETSNIMIALAKMKTKWLTLKWFK